MSRPLQLTGLAAYKRYCATAVPATRLLQAQPETYSQPEPVSSLLESSTRVASMNGASPRRAHDEHEDDDREEDDHEEDNRAKVSAEGTRLVWPARVAIAL